MDDKQLELPLDERYRKAEQFSLDLGEAPKQQSQPQDFAQEKTCNRAGYCYCPKCNPR